MPSERSDKLSSARQSDKDPISAKKAETPKVNSSENYDNDDFENDNDDDVVGGFSDLDSDENK